MLLLLLKQRQLRGPCILNYQSITSAMQSMYLEQPRQQAFQDLERVGLVKVM